MPAAREIEAGKALGLTLRDKGASRIIPPTTELAYWALEHDAEPGVSSSVQPRL